MNLDGVLVDETDGISSAAHAAVILDGKQQR
jgi:hypothetical protein